MIGGLDVYIRNSIIHNDSNNEYIIVHGNKDNNKPIIKNEKTIKEYSISLYRSLNPYNDIKAIYQTIKIVKKEKPDLIHCHSAKGGIVGRITGWITNTKTFYTPHAFSFLSTPSKFKSSIFILIERLTRFNAYILACSESEREIAQKKIKYSKEHSLVWHNAVPDCSLEKGEKPIIDYPFVCYIGRPCYQKNTLFLLDVIKKVKDKGFHLKFLLLGVGYHSPELNLMKSKIKELNLQEYIQLTPWINHSDCQEIVRKSLFYLTTSLYEGLPLAVIEAMANGKAIIASKVLGNIDCVSNGINGFLLPLDTEIFAERIILLAEDEKMRLNMEKESREIFEAKFFIKKQISQLQSIYEQ